MVAIEMVFVKSVSQALIRAARKLYRVSDDLSVLHRMIEQTHPPKAPRRTPRKPMPRNRRKKPD